MNIKNEVKLIFKRKKILRCILIAVIPSILFYVFSLIFLSSRGFTIREVIKEAAHVTNSSSFLGFLSNIGVWLWITSATICFFTILKSKKQWISKDQKNLLILTGALSYLLAFDDFFMIHDRYIHQNICYIVYAILALSILTFYFKTILLIDGFAFLAAGFFLALSILIDSTQDIIHVFLNKNIVQVFEEGFKFIGIVIWLYFNYNLASYESSQKKLTQTQVVNL